MRFAAGAVGVAGIAALMGGLFLFRPGADPRVEPGGLAPGEWALEATVRVQPAPDGLGLQESTRRAGEIIRARAEALNRPGVTADPIAPGVLRVVIPWGTTAGDFNLYTQMPDITLVDLDDRLVADTVRDPRGVVRWLEGAERAGSPGAEWVAVSASGVVLGGPYPARQPRYRGARWLRPPAGVHLVRIPREAAGYRDTGTAADFRPAYAVVVDPPIVEADDVIIARRQGQRLVLGLRDPIAVTGRHTYAIAYGAVIGRVLPAARGEVVRVVRAGPNEIPPGSAAVSLVGGGLRADLTVESTRLLGSAPRRTGTPSVVVPELRRRYARSEAFTSDGRPVPRWSTALDVLTARTPQGTWRLTEVLTDQDDVPIGFLTGPHGGQTWSCVLGPTASIVRACDRSGAHVIGRAAPGVTSVEVRYRSGAVRTAVVQNGWFLLLAGRGDGAVIVALDEDGKVLRAIPRR
ncbi:MAG: hypothetical protein U0237_03730 [Thermoleophilia bacterium]